MGIQVARAQNTRFTYQIQNIVRMCRASSH